MFANKASEEELVLPQSPDDLANGNEAKLLAALQNTAAWAKVPLLNYTPLDQLRDLSLVRFRGMIQDIKDPEIYLRQFVVNTANGGKQIRNGKYRDCLPLKANETVDYEAEKTKQGDRHTYHVVSIPGMNSWMENYERECNERITAPARTTADAVKQQPAAQSNDTAKKRAVEEAMDLDIPIVTVVGCPSNNAYIETHKRQCIAAGSDDKAAAANSTLSKEYMINSPIPDRPGKACLVKIYSDTDSYALNTVIDVIGFLSVDPSLCATAQDADAFADMDEVHAHNPPPSLIPRLHAIAVHKLPHVNPLMDMHLLPAAGISHVPQDVNMASVRKDLHKLLSLCLFNDDLAADYVLSHLLSSIYIRSEVQSIGNFPINVCNIPREVLPSFSKHFYSILELLVPASHYLPMSLDTLNNAAFVPIKDYKTNVLVSGVLQLAPHTHLILDETQLHQGKLEATGVQTLKHLSNLIMQQQIKANFKYFDMDYNVDIPVLIISEGKSLLPHEVLVPLQPDPEAVLLIDETYKAAHHFLNAKRLYDIRRFLTIGKIDEFLMNPEDPEMVQNDYIKIRRLNSNFNVYDLHRFLVFSRLLGIAHGKKTLDKESWDLAKKMETSRCKRVEAMPKSGMILNSDN